MAFILFLVFALVFGLVAVVMFATSRDSSQQQKQTMAMLDTALIARSSNSVEDELLDIRKQEILSSIPWLDSVLFKLDFAPRLRLLLSQADLQWTVGGLLLMMTAAFVLVAWLVQLRTDSAIIGVVAGSVGAFLPLGWVLRARSKRFERFEQRLPDALDLMVSALRAGHSLVSAIGIVSRETPDPLNKEFRLCFDEQNFGVELRTAMLSLAARIPTPDVRMVVTAILIQKDSGGNLAEVLEKVGNIMRERFRLRRQIRVHTAQARLTGWILASLPVILGFGLYMVNPSQMSVLFTREEGRILVYTAAVMTVIGALVIRRIIRIRI